MNLRKVFIIGGPASGKTTLSQAVAETLDVPVYELDALLLDGHERGEPFDVVSDDVTSSIIAMETGARPRSAKVYRAPGYGGGDAVWVSCSGCPGEHRRVAHDSKSALRHAQGEQTVCLRSRGARRTHVANLVQPGGRRCPVKRST